MIIVIVKVLLAIWIIVGALVGGVFHLEGRLPHANPYKNAIGLLFCGPVVWIIKSIGWLFRTIYTTMGDWLVK